MTMILAFKISKKDNTLNKCILELKERYRTPNNQWEIASKPYIGTKIITKKNVIILKTDIIYTYLNPILYLIGKIIFNKYTFYYAIKKLLKKQGYNGTTKILNKTQTIEALIS